MFLILFIFKPMKKLIFILLLLLSSCYSDVPYAEDDTTVINRKTFTNSLTPSKYGKYRYEMVRIDSDGGIHDVGTFFSNEEFQVGDRIKFCKK
jgi:hypothetical protein